MPCINLILALEHPLKSLTVQQVTQLSRSPVLAYSQSGSRFLRSYARAVLGIVILSVRRSLSPSDEFCDKTKKTFCRHFDII